VVLPFLFSPLSRSSSQFAPFSFFPQRTISEREPNIVTRPPFFFPFPLFSPLTAHGEHGPFPYHDKYETVEGVRAPFSYFLFPFFSIFLPHPFWTVMTLLLLFSPSFLSDPASGSLNPFPPLSFFFPLFFC